MPCMQSEKCECIHYFQPCETSFCLQGAQDIVYVHCQNKFAETSGQSCEVHVDVMIGCI